MCRFYLFLELHLWRVYYQRTLPRQVLSALIELFMESLRFFDHISFLRTFSHLFCPSIFLPPLVSSYLPHAEVTGNPGIFLNNLCSKFTSYSDSFFNTFKIVSKKILYKFIKIRQNKLYILQAFDLL